MNSEQKGVFVFLSFFFSFYLGEGEMRCTRALGFLPGLGDGEMAGWEGRRDWEGKPQHVKDWTELQGSPRLPSGLRIGWKDAQKKGLKRKRYTRQSPSNTRCEFPAVPRSGAARAYFSQERCGTTCRNCRQPGKHP